MKTAALPMTEDELLKLENQLAAASPEEGITIAYQGSNAKGEIAGRHPIKWNVDFEFKPNVLTISASGLFAGKVIDRVSEKLTSALDAMRRPA